jgi:hypothetical protein
VAKYLRNTELLMYVEMNKKLREMMKRIERWIDKN